MAIKKKSGGARMRASGRSLVWVTLDDEQKQQVRTAAGFAGKPMSQFLIDAGLAAARKILDKIGDNRVLEEDR